MREVSVKTTRSLCAPERAHCESPPEWLSWTTCRCIPTLLSDDTRNYDVKWMSSLSFAFFVRTSPLMAVQGKP